MSRAHLALVAPLGPCAEGRAWLLSLPDTVSIRDAFHTADPEWAEWLEAAAERNPERVPAALGRALPHLAHVKESEWFFRAFRAAVRGKKNRKALEGAHPADAWTIPAIISIPVGGTSCTGASR